MGRLKKELYIRNLNVLNFCASNVCLFFTHRNGTKEKWYKFNDTIVEEFDMNEDTLEAECFGGTYKATVYDTGEMTHKHT